MLVRNKAVWILEIVACMPARECPKQKANLFIVEVVPPRAGERTP